MRKRIERLLNIFGHSVLVKVVVTLFLFTYIAIPTCVGLMVDWTLALNIAILSALYAISILVHILLAVVVYNKVFKRKKELKNPS